MVEITINNFTFLLNILLELFKKFIMDHVRLAVFISFNIAVGAYLWLHWKTIPDIQESRNDEIFIPTNEWKPIGKDQSIPKGLHVRINLQTGEREAKLLEKDEVVDDNDKTSLMSVSDEADVNIAHSDSNDWNYDELKKSLKNIKNEAEKDTNVNNDQPIKKFRTYEQLKKELDGLNINVKTDSEILDDIFKKFNEKYKITGKICSKEEPALISMLKDLENLLHQVDNAEDFSRQHGIYEILLPCLSSNSTNLRTISARVLGAAVQNNPKVQIAALEASVITPLLKTIALTKNYEARSSSIFALSCLIRSFPFAEIKLIEEGGLSVLLSLFEETSADALKLQMKVVNLFYDLTMEREDAEHMIEEDQLSHNVSNERISKEIEQTKEKLRQYNKVNLKAKLIDRGWCLKLGYLLTARMPDSNSVLVTDVDEDAVNHDIVEKVAKAMLSFASACRTQFQTGTKLPQILKNLLTYYERLITKDELYKDIYDTVQLLNTRLNLS